MGTLNIRNVIVAGVAIFFTLEVMLYYVSPGHMMYFHFQKLFYTKDNITNVMVKNQTTNKFSLVTNKDSQEKKTTERLGFKTKNVQVTTGRLLLQTITHKFFNEFSARNCNYITWNYHPAMGIGNRMFIYASLYGISKENNKIPYIPNMDYDLDKIFTVSILPHKINPNPEFDARGESGCCRFDSGSAKLECKKNVMLGGYRQSWKYFEKYEDDVKKQFKFVKSIDDQCGEKILNISEQFNCKPHECVFVGAHMRRGDFVFPHKQQFGHSPATEDYLKKAINYYDELLRNTSKSVIYIILGNDYDWNYKSSQNITKNIVVAMKPETAGLDLCILTKCNHTILSAGSYGWWAAFLAGGTATYMKNQCRPGSSLCTEIEPGDYINPKWPWTAL